MYQIFRSKETRTFFFYFGQGICKSVASLYINTFRGLKPDLDPCQRDSDPWHSWFAGARPGSDAIMVLILDGNSEIGGVGTKGFISVI